MSILAGSSNICITGGTFVVHESEGKRGRALEKLSEVAAHSAIYDSAAQFDAPKCHPETRTQILDRLERWMCEPLKHEDWSLVWLHGGAGVGKSAILQTISGRCIARRAVLGTFFFSRTDSTRNHAEALIPTLAYQMALVFPQIIPILDHSFRDDPLLFTRSIRTLADRLLVRPLLHLRGTGVIDRRAPCARTFVIDALDECSNPKKQVAVINIISELLTSNDLPVGFLISSRPEPNIVYTFKTAPQIRHAHEAISLSDLADADSDIRIFIEESFYAIRMAHPHLLYLPSEWPLETDIDALIQKSSGHFLYAATAMKYCASIKEDPMRSLEVVLGAKPSRRDLPFAPLDALYIQILRSATYPTQVLEILRHCTMTNLPQSLEFICALLDYSPHDVELFLADVRSLVSVDETSPGRHPDGMRRVSIRQASVPDFLRDAARACDFYLDIASYWASKLPQYLKLIDAGVHLPRLHVADCLLYQLTLSIKSLAPEQRADTSWRGYTPKNIWDFCQNMDETIDDDNVFASKWVSSYMDTIRDIGINDNKLYSHHLLAYVELLEACCPIISPIIFPILLSAPPTIIARPLLSLTAEWVPLSKYLSHIYDGYATSVNPRTYSTYINLPGRALDTGVQSSLSHAALRSLEILFGQKEAAIHDDHPFGHFGHPTITGGRYISRSIRLRSNRWLKTKHPSEIMSQLQRRHVIDNRRNYYLLLRIVRFTLLRIKNSAKIAKYTRKLLPMGAFRFPGAAKRLRRTMDQYTVRWYKLRIYDLKGQIEHGSREALIELLSLYNIDDVD